MGEGLLGKKVLAKRTPHPSMRVAVRSCPLPQGERARAATAALAAIAGEPLAHILISRCQTALANASPPADIRARAPRVSLFLSPTRGSRAPRRRGVRSASRRA